MGLMGTLAKVAIGYAAARGVDRMSDGQGLAALLGGLGASSDNNPFADMMGQTKGGAPDLSAFMGQAPGAGSGAGGPAGLLSQLGAGGSGLAGMMAAMGGMAASAQGQGAAALLDAFGQSPASSQMEHTAGLMLRAMIQAAKADGDIDASEKAKILECLGDAPDAQDLAFVQAQLDAPLNPEALARDTPEPQRAQVYAASLMTIRADQQAEIDYLRDLAGAMSLDATTVAMLHAQMGAPAP